MTLVAGAVSFTETWSAEAVAERVAQAAARYSTLQPKLLYSSQNIVLYAVNQIDAPCDLTIIHVGEGESWWIIGESGSFQKHVPTIEAAERRREFWHISRISGRWLGIRTDSRSNSIQVATDRLGIQWLYVGEMEDGFAFSSDYGAVARQLNRRLTINYEVAVEELALGYPLDEATVFNEISLIPPGSLVELGPDGMVILEKQPINYGDRNAGLSIARRYGRLDEIYESIMQRYADGLNEPPLLSISGGFDSRYCLAFLDRYSVDPTLFTFGHPSSRAVTGAKEVCASLGKITSVFHVEKTDWEQWRRCIEQLGNCGIVQWAGWSESWLKVFQDRGDLVFIGYLGDALSGKHLGGRRQRGCDGWSQYWAKWSMDEGWAECSLLRERARMNLLQSVYDRLESAIAMVEYAFPHQRALHFDLFGRQRRWVAAQPNLISRFVTPGLFFYDNDLIDFWTNVRVDDLLGQRLYLSYAQDRFPRLFPQGEGEPISTTTRIGRKARNLMRSATGRSPLPKKPAAINREVIIMPHREQILALIDRIAPLLDCIIDTKRMSAEVSNYGYGQSITSGQLIRAVNLFHLVNLRME